MSWLINQIDNSFYSGESHSPWGKKIFKVCKKRVPDYCENCYILNPHQPKLNRVRAKQRQTNPLLEKSSTTPDPSLPFIDFQLISLCLPPTLRPVGNYSHGNTVPQKTPLLLPKYTERPSHSLMVAELGKEEQMACKKSVSVEGSPWVLKGEGKQRKESFHQLTFSQDTKGLREQECFSGF